MAKRKALSKRTRFEVFKRDEFTCQYCGGKPPNVVLVIDHIMPVASGGSNAQTNLITSCDSCNSGKSDVPLEKKPRALKETLAKMAEAREQFEEYNRYIAEADERIARDAYALGVYWCDIQHDPSEQGKWVASHARQVSIKNFLKQLPRQMIADAMDIAISRVKIWGGHDDKAWRYFCGVCWTKIRNEKELFNGSST